MMTFEVSREILPGGVVQLTSDGCTFRYCSPSSGVLHISISGHDKGQFGSSSLDEILGAIMREGKILLLVDARNVSGIAVTVSDLWTKFFSLNKERLERVHVLVNSGYTQLTMAIAQHLSGTGDLIKIHSDERTFDRIVSSMGKTIGRKH
ncbi:MAG: hypothetical protein M3R08_03500 [Bacteroidota bacterium]|nr:hypothetical protein [Bacteroidota bacterium]